MQRSIPNSHVHRTTPAPTRRQHAVCINQRPQDPHVGLQQTIAQMHDLRRASGQTREMGSLPTLIHLRHDTHTWRHQSLLRPIIQTRMHRGSNNMGKQTTNTAPSKKAIEKTHQSGTTSVRGNKTIGHERHSHHVQQRHGPTRRRPHANRTWQTMAAQRKHSRSTETTQHTH